MKAAPSKTLSVLPLTQPLTLSFSAGWRAPKLIQVTELKAWKDLDIPVHKPKLFPARQPIPRRSKCHSLQPLHAAF